MTIFTVNSREARANWRDLLDKVLKGDADVIIERNGKPVAALIPVEDYQELLDELDDLRAARRAMEALEEWKKDTSTARPWEEVESEMIATGLLDD